MPSDLNFSGFGKNASLIDAEGKVLDALGHAGKSVLAVQLITLESKSQFQVYQPSISPYSRRFVCDVCLLFLSALPDHVSTTYFVRLGGGWYG